MCHLNIPFTLTLGKVTEPDQNGIMYTEEAIRKALEKIPGDLPLLIGGDSAGKENPCEWDPAKVIGKVTSAKFDDGNLTFSGVLFEGGTREMVSLEGKTVTEATITAVSLVPGNRGGLTPFEQKPVIPEEEENNGSKQD